MVFGVSMHAGKTGTSLKTATMWSRKKKEARANVVEDGGEIVDVDNKILSCKPVNFYLSKTMPILPTYA